MSVKILTKSRVYYKDGCGGKFISFNDEVEGPNDGKILGPVPGFGQKQPDPSAIVPPKQKKKVDLLSGIDKTKKGIDSLAGLTDSVKGLFGGGKGKGKTPAPAPSTGGVYQNEDRGGKPQSKTEKIIIGGVIAAVVIGIIYLVVRKKK